MCDAGASNEHVGVTPQRHRLQRFHSDLAQAPVLSDVEFLATLVVELSTEQVDKTLDSDCDTAIPCPHSSNLSGLFAESGCAVEDSGLNCHNCLYLPASCGRNLNTIADVAFVFLLLVSVAPKTESLTRERGAVELR